MQELFIFGGLILLAILYLKNKKDIQGELILAFIISFFWVAFSGLYNYRDGNWIIQGINLFPLIAWTTGLVILKEISETKKFKKNKYLKVTLVYVSILLVLEWVGYNLMGIQLASNHPGLFNLELLHVPLFGKIYYLSAGTIFVWVCNKLKIK